MIRKIISSSALRLALKFFQQAEVVKTLILTSGAVQHLQVKCFQ